jgi:hypothetical protein
MRLGNGCGQWKKRCWCCAPIGRSDVKRLANRSKMLVVDRYGKDGLSAEIYLSYHTDLVSNIAAEKHNLKPQAFFPHLIAI